ncbi:MAG: hypothetical protein CMJ23_05185 [Phycisphaerae bacterium]|nr:hypothetical protein [Phycisphaerae bacterium]
MSDQRWIDRVRHAFAVEDADAFVATEAEADVAGRICREVVRRRMTMPATMLLEMSRPLNYLGAQALHFFTPFATILVDARAWETFAGFVERRGSVEYMIRLIDECEAAHVPVGGDPGSEEGDGVTVVDDEIGSDGPSDLEPRGTDPDSGGDQPPTVG